LITKFLELIPAVKNIIKYLSLQDFKKIISNIICMAFDAVVVFGLRFLTFYQNWFDHTVIFRTQKRDAYFSGKKSFN